MDVHSTKSQSASQGRQELPSDEGYFVAGNAWACTCQGTRVRRAGTKGATSRASTGNTRQGTRRNVLVRRGVKRHDRVRQVLALDTSYVRDTHSAAAGCLRCARLLNARCTTHLSSSRTFPAITPSCSNSRPAHGRGGDASYLQLQLHQPPPHCNQSLGPLQTAQSKVQLSKVLHRQRAGTHTWWYLYASTRMRRYKEPASGARPSIPSIHQSIHTASVDAITTTHPSLSRLGPSSSCSKSSCMRMADSFPCSLWPREVRHPDIHCRDELTLTRANSGSACCARWGSPCPHPPLTGIRRTHASHACAGLFARTCQREPSPASSHARLLRQLWAGLAKSHCMREPRVMCCPSFGNGRARMATPRHACKNALDG